nr:MAG TPA: IBV 3C protein [Caudoviricetes sp.]
MNALKFLIAFIFLYLLLFFLLLYTITINNSCIFCK